MNKLTSEAVAFAEEIKAKKFANAEEVAILAPFTQLSALGAALKGSGIGFGAQNVHFEPSGAFTGEISVPMLTEIGVDYCIVGHSERREYFGETDETVNKKLKALIAAGITPILCVGESLEVREGKGEQTFVAAQLVADFDSMPREDAAKVVIAYEPIWAIGTGVTATSDQAEEVCGWIRALLVELYGAEVAEEVRVLYGGSVNGGNAAELFAKPNIDGGLVGGASLKASFADIIHYNK